MVVIDNIDRRGGGGSLTVHSPTHSLFTHCSLTVHCPPFCRSLTHPLTRSFVRLCACCCRPSFVVGALIELRALFVVVWCCVVLCWGAGAVWSKLHAPRRFTVRLPGRAVTYLCCCRSYEPLLGVRCLRCVLAVGSRRKRTWHALHGDGNNSPARQCHHSCAPIPAALVCWSARNRSRCTRTHHCACITATTGRGMWTFGGVRCHTHGAASTTYWCIRAKLAWIRETLDREATNHRCSD